METRIQIDQVVPEAIRSMLTLERFVQSSSLSKVQMELIKIRASQLNKCAYCINMHTRDALKIGISQERIFLLNAWEESDLFTPEEQLLLKITEEVTLISESGLSSETYERALEVFGEKMLAELIMAVITINSWNRIAVSTLKPLD
ncbi:carboxymuconolactone decarboxylase family protein [Robertkochia solimangrovi]|uniref:carboxymuconolactone decarboxylase family protein n=1 Tax=Robertkochia solimangrovi TaxID=2213046 RepID=UPI00117F5CFB|nr:carboxymuconolactone decarboxylase family protein [Robertkochia solimangrovi]TRZ46428.1 carboxymuconolactone decarboxylase family protein [Robertkochia solimangrovi]